MICSSAPTSIVSAKWNGNDNPYNYKHNDYVTLTLTVDSAGNLTVSKASGGGTVNNPRYTRGGTVVTTVDWSGSETLQVAWDNTGSGDHTSDIALTYTLG